MEYDLYFWLMTGIYLNRMSRDNQLLPQPVGPISIRLFLATICVSTIYPRRIVSIVGMNLVNAEPFLFIIAWSAWSSKELDLLGLSFKLSHSLQEFVSRSKYISNRLLFGGIGVKK